MRVTYDLTVVHNSQHMFRYTQLNDVRTWTFPQQLLYHVINVKCD